MKKALPYLLAATVSLFGSCRGECVRCQKAGQSTLSYCENDFPDSHTYHSQINGLDSLGYSCIVK